MWLAVYRASMLGKRKESEPEVCEEAFGERMMEEIRKLARENKELFVEIAKEFPDLIAYLQNLTAEPQTPPKHPREPLTPSNSRTHPMTNSPGTPLDVVPDPELVAKAKNISETSLKQLLEAGYPCLYDYFTGLRVGQANRRLNERSQPPGSRSPTARRRS